jgi:hypothetical protein
MKKSHLFAGGFFIYKVLFKLHKIGNVNNPIATCQLFSLSSFSSVLLLKENSL